MPESIAKLAEKIRQLRTEHKPSSAECLTGTFMIILRDYLRLVEEDYGREAARMIRHALLYDPPEHERHGGLQ